VDRRTAVLRRILLALSPEALCRIARVANVRSADVDVLLSTGAVDLSLIVRLLTPFEWKTAMQRLGSLSRDSERLVS
jgi:hypothetical protein